MYSLKSYLFNWKIKKFHEIQDTEKQVYSILFQGLLRVFSMQIWQTLNRGKSEEAFFGSVGPVE